MNLDPPDILPCSTRQEEGKQLTDGRFYQVSTDCSSGARFELEIAPPLPDLDCIMRGQPDHCLAAEISLTYVERAVLRHWDESIQQAVARILPEGNERPERIRMTLTRDGVRRLRDYLNEVIEK